jgi:phospholipase C
LESARRLLSWAASLCFAVTSRLYGRPPASSKWTLFEAFAQNIIQLAQSNPEQWAETAIFVTVDEGGGFYDSGFIQPVDFFGNGPRIPMIAVSP